MADTRRLELALRPPFDAPALLDHLARRSVPGIETLEAGDGVYTRSLALPGGPGVVRIPLGAQASCAPSLPIELTLADPRDEAAAVARLRALLDLDADPGPVAAALGDDPLIGEAVTAAPGRRVPGAVDATELIVRAILGQQISLAGAATAAGRLVARCGQPLGSLARGPVTHLFPTAGALAALDPQTLAMPRARGRSLVAVAGALAGGELVLVRGGDPGPARRDLLALPGVGPWTADYVVMRVLGDHDVFLASDLGVRRALQRAGAPADPRAASALAARWSPFRSYALQYVWTLPAGA
jgi:AraC family transcriptional regulator, regulatory protein of adaptative response / DNA-3-methyladenine glycosylase II